MNNSRNLILAVVLSALLLFGWDAAMGWLYPQPVEVQQAEKVDTPAENAALTNSGTNNGGTVGAGPVAPTVDLATALRGGNRVRIDAPRVQGSINLEGARIDDLVLKDYRESTEPGADYVRLFAPEGTETQQWAEFGFLANGQRAGMGATWTADGDVLSPDSPVVLTRTGEDGLRYRIALSIDDEYMITAQQTVGNPGQSGAVIQPFSYIARTSDTATKDMWIAHSGPIGVFDGSADYDFDYDDVAEAGSVAAPGRAAWLGFTDIYWLSALVPVQTAEFRADFRSLGNDLFRADLIHDPVTLAGGQQTSSSTRLFAGAKESAVLDAYQDSGITQFGLAIDWGWFRWFEKPLLWLLRFFNGVVGNFGVAIILLTVVVRGLMFPVAQKQFSSMAAMKAIQPKMKAVQEKYKDDRTKQQQEIQKLFKDEGVNPLAGCLPLILQIPIFFALYKVLILAIEMRHEKFLWVHDLSAPDPWNLANGLAALGIEVPSYLMIVFGIGVLALLLGFTMWLTFKMNPSAMDPVQQQIFSIMPWILMFVMAPFAAGLLLYWNTSNILTLAQQKYLYSKNPQLRAAAEKERAEKAAAAAAKANG
ncbi:membrane protein insertase YidC [Qipengyuania pelagi]|uniref:Membrane protein insertase YidC n=1 Tax=Qipengyuania pelagi TaxID=994320 RepID=A0A844Y5W8_9SPHN|nr:membrane protein insertase YidC [Qipengyuania pelagi]MXO52438.1 membrane protein insertase YidC [Qipengyuania pelagi]